MGWPPLTSWMLHAALVGLSLSTPNVVSDHLDSMGRHIWTHWSKMSFCIMQKVLVPMPDILLQTDENEFESLDICVNG